MATNERNHHIRQSQSGSIKGTKSGVFTYSIYFHDHKQNSYSMSDKYTLNLTVASCKYLTNRNFQNIIIDLGHEPYLNERPKLIKPIESVCKFYVVGSKRKDEFTVFFTNSIQDILLFINENLREDSEKFQFIQIVNCIPK